MSSNTPPQSLSTLRQVVDSVFERYGNRSTKSLAQSTTRQEAGELASHEPQALRTAIDWSALRPALRELRQLAGLSSLSLTWKQWLLLIFVVLGSVSVLPKGLTANLLANIALALLIALPFWLRKQRVEGFRAAVTPRVMHYDSFDRGRQFAHRFVYSGSLEGGSPSALTLDVAEEITVEPATGWSIGLFSKSGSCFALLARSGQQVEVVAVTTPPMRWLVAASALPSVIESIAEDSAKANNALLGHDVAAERSVVTPESVAAIWEKVALPQPTAEHLIQSQLLFTFADPSAPRGILFKGPPGTGKSLIAQTFAKASGAPLLRVSLADLKGAHIGESAQRVKDLWHRARADQPAIVFVDECEGAFPKRGSDHADTFTNEIVQTFLAEWDGGNERSHVLVLAATNRPELLDDAVLSRFSDVIEIQTPSGASFAELVARVFEQVGLRVAVSPDLLRLVGGMTGRELRNVAERALRAAGNRPIDFAMIDAAVTAIRGKGATKADASASWSTLVLGADIIKKLQSLTAMAAQAPALIERGVPVPRAVLLYGPPGTGKTQIARTLANEARMTFIAKSTADLKGQYLGHAAARVKAAFESARGATPAILFLDEIDALASSRGGSDSDDLQKEALIQLLQEMDGISFQAGYVLVIGATNVPDALDSAILSRFAQRIEIPLPDVVARKHLLKTATAGRPVATDLDFDAIAVLTEGWSGRDLNALVADAFGVAVSRCLDSGEDMNSVTLTHSDITVALSGDGKASTKNG